MEARSQLRHRPTCENDSAQTISATSILSHAHSFVKPRFGNNFHLFGFYSVERDH